MSGARANPEHSSDNRFVGARDRLGATLLLSLLLHAGLGLTWGAWGGLGSGESRIPAMEGSPQTEEVRLGLDKARAVTLAWMGYVEPTEHQAPRSVTQQSEAVLASATTIGGARAGEGIPAEAPASSSDTEARPADPLETEAEAPVEEGAGRGEGGSRAVSELEAAEWAIPTALAIRDRLVAIGEALEEAARAVAEASSSASPTHPSPGATPGGPPGPPEAGDGLVESELPREAGTPSDRESPATSLKEPVEVEPGRVAVAEGLKIMTRRPRWTTRTLVMTNPRNPTVDISFGRDGRVLRAVFAKEGARRLNTGYESVDQPLLSAIYQWRASGERLLALPADDPEAALTVRMRIKLR